MNVLAEMIDRAARWYGDADAVVDGPRRLSFRDTDLRSNRLANALAALSPGTGQRVALLLGNRLEFVECDFAIAKAGKVRAPINPRLVDREREWILTNTGADTLIFEPAFAGFVEEARERLPVSGTWWF